LARLPIVILLFRCRLDGRPPSPPSLSARLGDLCDDPLVDELARAVVVEGGQRSDNGQARSPSSLSGGEKFVASLALALGMVEMMGRQGGRIESLFLDEGFGALDRTNLDAAVEALGSVAATGRLVAIITHLQRVAEQIEHVLLVTREPTGTRAVWLNRHERSELAEANAALGAGLLE